MTPELRSKFVKRVKPSPVDGRDRLIAKMETEIASLKRKVWELKSANHLLRLNLKRMKW